MSTLRTYARLLGLATVDYTALTKRMLTFEAMIQVLREIIED